MSPRKQLAIAGTEPKKNQEIEDAAEIYRNAVMDRLEMQKKEKQFKDELAGIVHRKIIDGTVEVPPAAIEKGEEVIVYSFMTDEGEMHVKYRRQELIKVNKSKDDDEE